MHPMLMDRNPRDHIGGRTITDYPDDRGTACPPNDETSLRRGSGTLRCCSAPGALGLAVQSRIAVIALALIRKPFLWYAPVLARNENSNQD